MPLAHPYVCYPRSSPALETAALEPDDHLQELLARIQDGDETAFNQLFEAVNKRIYRYARYLVSDHSLAEEIASDVFRQVWTKARSYDSARASAYNWLLLLTRSRAIDHLRRRKRLQLRDSPDRDFSDFASSAEGAEQRLLRACRERNVTGILEGLPVSQRSLLHLAFYEDFTHREIAQITGLPLGTVKTRIRSALQTMRQHCS